MITAVQLKRFFKNKFGIPVRANAPHGHQRNGKKVQTYISVRIAPDPPKNGKHWVGNEPMVHSYTFPPELRNQCLRIIYPNSPTMHEQTSGGNISSINMAMFPP